MSACKKCGNSGDDLSTDSECWACGDGLKVNSFGLITSPGKFEGAPRYAPWFWSRLEEAESDDGPRVTWKLLDEDRKRWPELKGRRKVVLLECDNVCVVEI